MCTWPKPICFAANRNPSCKWAGPPRGIRTGPLHAACGLIAIRKVSGAGARTGQPKRLFGPCGRAARQDVLAADLEAWVAHRKAKKKRGKKKTEGGGLGKNKGRKVAVGRSMVPTGARGFGTVVINVTAKTIRRRNARRKMQLKVRLRQISSFRARLLGRLSIVNLRDQQSVRRMMGRP